MRTITKWSSLILLVLLESAAMQTNKSWTYVSHNIYILNYTKADEQNKIQYLKIIDNGIETVTNFFGSSFKAHFDVYIHPGRYSLDSTWQSDWKMPDYKSECWMVASGIARKVDMISPKIWDSASCEHKYSDTLSTQRLITHELVHVFHGQVNISPDFSHTDGIDWFVEGLAAFASGQCDSSRLADVKKLILDKKAPAMLDDFWKGPLKYWLSGSMVSYIDIKYGRKKLTELLPFNKKSDILMSLNLTESELLNDWKKYLTQ